jgi:predicted enzyme related to lactoylglutathione lyase
MSTSTQQGVGIESLDVVPVVVEDVEAAIEFYTGTLGFEVRTDQAFEMEGATGRWVTVGVPGDGVQLTLMAADEPYYDEASRAFAASRLGTQTYYTFRTADCEASVETLESAGVEITREPQEYPWGTEAMFADPDGNEFGVFEYAGA